MKTIFFLFCLSLTSFVFGQLLSSTQPIIEFKQSPLVNFSQFATIADSVEPYREKRLISAQDFVAFSKEKNTIILDTRSRFFFAQKHVKGAINLPFADFTQGTLEALIPDKNTRILIYCNNNFMATSTTDFIGNIRDIVEDPSFASKVSKPLIYDTNAFKLTGLDSLYLKPIKFNTHESFNHLPFLTDQLINDKTYTLALNIPTFINLYGYGYQNVYELKDLIFTSSSGELAFEGTEVISQDQVGKLISAVPSSPLVSFSDLQELIDIVFPYRLNHLVSLDQFNEMKMDRNTIILDTRSQEMYDAKHVKGAIHLEFSELTQSTLDLITGFNRNKRILIYCNNNFITDFQKHEQDRYFRSQDPYFMSKVALSPPAFMTELTLALNIPTYINLYGYGFKNVYELNELVVTSDPRIQFEGTAVE